MIQFKFCKLANEHARLPERGTHSSAGYDFFSPVDFTVEPGEQFCIMTGIKAQMEPGMVLMMYPRSSMGIKRNVILANTTGIIDADYYDNPSNEGNIGIILYNYGDEPQSFIIGDKIAQGIFVKYYVTDTDSVTTFRNGGIGSTGA